MKRIQTSVFILFCAVSLVVLASPAWSQDYVQRDGPRQMQGARPLGMGGAFVAVTGTDFNAMFYNPAAINDYEEKLHFQFVLPTAEMSSDLIDFAGDVLELADDIDAANTNGDKTDVFDAFIQANAGRFGEAGARGSVIMATHKWITASIFYDAQSFAGVRNPTSATLEIEGLGQGGLMAGSAYGFYDGRLQVGVALKFVARYLVDETLTQRDIVANNDFEDAIQYEDVGFGIGGDIGFKATPTVSGETWEWLKPSFGLTIQDVGHTRFFAGDDVGKQDESITLGFAVHPDFYKFKNTFAIDVREMEYRKDFLHKFHMGYEMMWPEISKVLRSVSVRAGLNQAYLTAGLGLDFKYFKLDAATYGREIAETTMQDSTRMYVVQLGAGF